MDIWGADYLAAKYLAREELQIKLEGHASGLSESEIKSLRSWQCEYIMDWIYMFSHAEDPVKVAGNFLARTKADRDELRRNQKTGGTGNRPTSNSADTIRFANSLLDEVTMENTIASLPRDISGFTAQMLESSLSAAFTQSICSRRIRLLAKAGFLNKSKEGKHIVYYPRAEFIEVYNEYIEAIRKSI